MGRLKIFASLMAFLCVTACTFGSGTKLAEKGVVAFHEMLNRGGDDQIYNGAGSEFRKVTTRQDFFKILQAVHNKLGAFRSGKTVGWTENTNTGGTYVTLNREAQFERGTAQEQFVFKLDGNKAVLLGYHVSSNLFTIS